VVERTGLAPVTAKVSSPPWHFARPTAGGVASDVRQDTPGATSLPLILFPPGRQYLRQP
jgi:hypothetical protein